MRILIASNNNGKLKEIKRILGDIYSDIITPSDLDLHLDVDEDGDAFLANATKKALAFMRASGMDALADDSGLCVDALDGLPGVHSARFASEYGDSNAGHDDAANNELLLQRMRGQRNRAARFISCVVLARTDGSVIDAHGESHGIIQEDYRGNGGFGYDPLFFDEELGKTYAELSLDEKNQVSHRAKALYKLYENIIQEKR